jgi:hypothetical protein
MKHLDNVCNGIAARLVSKQAWVECGAVDGRTPYYTAHVLLPVKTDTLTYDGVIGFTASGGTPEQAVETILRAVYRWFEDPSAMPELPGLITLLGAEESGDSKTSKRSRRRIR